MCVYLLWDSQAIYIFIDWLLRLSHGFATRFISLHLQQQGQLITGRHQGVAGLASRVAHELGQRRMDVNGVENIVQRTACAEDWQHLPPNYTEGSTSIEVCRAFGRAWPRHRRYLMNQGGRLATHDVHTQQLAGASLDQDLHKATKHGNTNRPHRQGIRKD